MLVLYISHLQLSCMCCVYCFHDVLVKFSLLVRVLILSRETAIFRSSETHVCRRELYPQASIGGRGDHRPASARPAPMGARRPSTTAGELTIRYDGDRGGAIDVVRPVTSVMPRATVSHLCTNADPVRHMSKSAHKALVELMVRFPSVDQEHFVSAGKAVPPSSAPCCEQ